jgi:hypothetical protein
MSHRLLIMLPILALALSLAGCLDDDDCECPACPEVTGPPEPTLDNIWPHADGTGWLYDLTVREYTTAGYGDDPPPLPTWAQIDSLLNEPAGVDLVSEDAGLYGLRFDGDLVTDTGVTGQDLVETIYADVWSEEGKAAAAPRPDPVALLVARARPDLRAALAARLGVDEAALLAALADKELTDMGSLYFLGAYAFAAEDDGYYGYGDLNTSHAWTYLEGPLEPGTTWSLQLVPDIADDIWLHGHVWSVEDMTVGGRAVDNAVAALYLVDLGLQTVTDEQGNIVGEFQAYMYGRTVFVPEVGPVACTERRLIGPDSILLPGDPVWLEAECEWAP